MIYWEGIMKAILCSAILALSAVALPASATPQTSQVARSQTGLPPGCFYVLHVVFCVDMPIEP
jgi:hypothetical protein